MWNSSKLRKGRVWKFIKNLLPPPGSGKMMDVLPKPQTFYAHKAMAAMYR
jgi:hypothetical protein